MTCLHRKHFNPRLSSQPLSSLHPFHTRLAPIAAFPSGYNKRGSRSASFGERKKKKKKGRGVVIEDGRMDG